MILRYTREKGLSMNVQYVVDDKGHPTSVVLPLAEYQEILEKLEDFEALEMVKERVAEGLDLMDFDEFVNGLQD